MATSEYLYTSCRIIVGRLASVLIPSDNFKTEYWIDDKYKLKFLGYSFSRPLYIDSEIYIFYKRGNLFKSVQNQITLLSQLTLEDLMYCDMVRVGKWFALRSGGTIRVSNDLVNWKVIYSGKRGIKDSMIALEKVGKPILIFIEYSTGHNKGSHRVLQYEFDNGALTTLKVFYSAEAHKVSGIEPFARHIHVISLDPFTGDIYIGTGDKNDESNIYVSHDNGDSFILLAGGNQSFRTLSFFFTEESIFWNTDTHESQSIIRLNRKNIDLHKIVIRKFPLINGALWCTIKTKLKDGTSFIIMSSNSEGATYDNFNRLYGIVIKDETPIVYELAKFFSLSCYSQAFPIGKDASDFYYFYDTRFNLIEKCKLVQI